MRSLPTQALLLLLMLLVTGAGTTAQAQPPDDDDAPADTLRAILAVQDLPEMTVLGSRVEQLEHLPGASLYLDPEILARLRPVHARDVVRRVPGVHAVDEDVLGRRLNIGVRGLNQRRSSRMLLLEDGAPIQLAPYGDPSAHYAPPTARVGSIEFLKGAGQTTYGPQTVGGVINFLSPAMPTTPGGQVQLRGGTRDYVAAHAQAGGTWGGLGVAVDVVHESVDGNRQDQRQRVNDVAARAAWQIAEAHRLMAKATVTFEQADMGEAGLRQRIFEVNPRANPVPDDQFLVDRQAAQLSHNWTLGQASTLTTQAYGHRFFRESIRQASSSAGLNNCPEGVDTADFSNATLCGNEQRPRTYHVLGAESRLRSFYNGGAFNGEVTAGIRYHREWVQRKRFVGNSSPTDDTRDFVNLRGRNRHQDNRIDTDAVALFAQHRFFLGRVTVTPGVRVETVAQANRNEISGASDRGTYTQWLPGLGATLRLMEGATAYGGVHRGFAPPRPDDVLDPGRDVLNQVNPEVSTNTELGLRGEPTPGLAYDLTFFRIDFTDQIIEETIPEGTRFINAGRTLHQGVELAGRLDTQALLRTPNNVHLSAGATYVPDARFTTPIPEEDVPEGNRLPYAPEWMLHLEVGHTWANGLDVRGGLRHISQQFSDPQNTRQADATGQEGLVPAYTVFHATASYPVRSSVDVFVSGRNLTDEVYIASRKDGVQPGQRRHVAAGFRWAF